MCGIAGFISLTGSPVANGQSALHVMSSLLAHRGPAGHGIWISDDGTVGLAHRRLAIIDLSDDASQPMLGEAGRVIVFNGEIYKYRELRGRFTLYGLCKQISCDTTP